MPTEGVNPTSAAVDAAVVKFTTNAYDDNVATICTLGYAAKPNTATVRFQSFGDGTVSPTQRRSVYLAVMGEWLTAGLSDATPYISIAFQIKRVVDSYWITLINERMAYYSSWPTGSWRRFDITSIVGEDDLSHYHVRIMHFVSDTPPDPLEPPYGDGGGT